LCIFAPTSRGIVLILKAPAKVNLHLEIRGRRADGYHEILSIFQSVKLFDIVQIRSLKGYDELRIVSTPPLGCEDNTVAKAVAVFRRHSGERRGVRIELKKNIPTGAGLGGASSDAAAVLIGLNRLLATVYSQQELIELALEVGADVPFFIGNEAALVSGRGEETVGLCPRHDFCILLVYPGFPILSRDAYAWYDEEIEGEFRSSVASDLQNVYLSSPVSAWSFYNSFEAVVQRRYPLIGKLREEIEDAGAVLAGLSGSGSTVFGIFEKHSAARRAHDLRYGRYHFVRIVKPLHSGATAHYNMSTRR
jgi:4-diphosphocytidyl-2-C-methyl-D-erythritol kinase